jgi:hypothetical protein
MILKVVRTPQ